MKKKSFLLYCDWQNPLNELTDQECGKLIKGIYSYVIDEKEPEFDEQGLRLIFSFIKSTLDRDNQAYKEKCRKNRENGKLGGRPKVEEKKATYNSFPPVMVPKI